MLGSKTVVVTDNNPLCFVLKNAKLDATSHRWLSSLSRFDFELKYKKGSTHIDADALSRRSQGPIEEDKQYIKTMEDISFLVEEARAFDDNSGLATVDGDSVHAIMQNHRIITESVCTTRMQRTSHDDALNGDNFHPTAEQLVRDPSLIPDDILEPKSQKKQVLVLM